MSLDKTRKYILLAVNVQAEEQESSKRQTKAPSELVLVTTRQTIPGFFLLTR
jgi:hypothetical protein